MRRHTKIKLSYKGVETELFSVISVPQNLELNKGINFFSSDSFDLVPQFRAVSQGRNFCEANQSKVADESGRPGVLRLKGVTRGVPCGCVL